MTDQTDTLPGQTPTIPADPYQYRPLSDFEHAQMVAIKEKGQEFLEMIKTCGGSRELSLAQTNAEQAVMWAVKHITR